MHRATSIHRVLSVAISIIAAIAGRASAVTFTNSTPITIPGPGSSGGTGISVSGLGNSLTGVSVQIMAFSDTDAQNVGLVLVGPTGAALVLEGGAGGSGPVPNVTLTLIDGATPLPSNISVAGAFASTQYSLLGSFPSPGPGLAYHSPAPFGTATLLTTFAGSNPNGTWSLYAMDPVSGDTGSIAGGWNVQITAVPEPAGLSLIALAGVCIARRRR